VGVGLRARCGGERTDDPSAERGGRLHARMFGFGSGHQFCQPEGDAGGGSGDRRAGRAAGDSLRQRAGTNEPSLSGVVCRTIELLHIQPGQPMQNGRVESFYGKLRDECLRVSWFGNLFEARRKIRAWRTEYNNQERPQSTLGYRTPEEFAREVGSEEGCGKDGGFVTLENAPLPTFPHPRRRWPIHPRCRQQLGGRSMNCAEIGGRSVPARPGGTYRVRPVPPRWLRARPSAQHRTLFDLVEDEQPTINA
jgi:integrase-like protein